MNSPEEGVRLLSDLPARVLKHQKLFRSIPTANPSKHLFWPAKLTQNEATIVDFFANIGSGIDHEAPKKDRWYQYGDCEKTQFCFDAVVIPATRFSDGFPVWYGSTDLDTSKAEIIHHLRRQAQVDLKGTELESSIVFQRAVCEAKVQMKGVDLSVQTPRLPELLEDGPPYPFCTKVGRLFYDKAFEGIVFSSRRKIAGLNYAAFRKSCIIESKVTCYFDVEVFKDGSLKVCNEDYP